MVSICLIAERLLYWRRVGIRQPRLIREVLRLYPERPLDAIRQLKSNIGLPMSRIFLEALELDRPTPLEFRLALESAAQAEIPSLKRFTAALDTIVSISPLLGLLGTILGLIRTFASLQIGQAGTESSAAVTGGISEALASTVMGLVVAIFTLLFSNFFRGSYQRQLAFIQEYGGQLELLYRRHIRRDESSSDREETEAA